ncbi:hypothetical protein Fmac_002683 [Flemingia macrophylla]|uniref:Uncharacterized protein n=1 Tax=Flemingia macrophylla TaxID=520843 RepID=A0ABD1NLE5_9FABA
MNADENYVTDGYLDTKVDCIPGMKNFRLKYMPGFIRTTDSNDIMVKFLTETAEKILRAFAVVSNTFNELECDVMNVLSSMLTHIYPIGPFPLFLNQNSQDHLASLESVVYVNFGSMTVMPLEKFLESAWGLANSKRPFLWIIRPDLVIGGSLILSCEFVNETSDRGKIASWSPQEQVLNHPSIGGFLTHCEWNSTIESIYAGVPMLFWPIAADQPTNCRYICNERGIGIEIDTNVKREKVEKLVNELMVGEKGKKMRPNVMKLKKAQENIRVGGHSYINFDKVISEVLLKLV